MTQIADVFARAKSEHRSVLIGYWPAGFPSYQGALAAIRTMVSSGVDIVEIGLSYSDPVMDGPVIQRAADQALSNGIRTKEVFQTVSEVSTLDIATLVMTYWNPVERYGQQQFAADLAAAGGVGVITPDLTPEEAETWLTATNKADIDPVFLVAPSSTDARIATISQLSQGFIYAASTMGVTGARDELSMRAPELVSRVRAVTDMPVAVGLGVRDGEQAAAVAQYADGVIVGSALVNCLLDIPEDKGIEKLQALTAELADGVRG